MKKCEERLELSQGLNEVQGQKSSNSYFSDRVSEVNNVVFPGVGQHSC